VTTGKWFWECTCGLNVAQEYVGVGIGTPNTSVAGTTTFLGKGADTIGYYPDDGFVYNNNAHVATYAVTPASPTLVGIALDLVNNRIWFRLGTAGLWNNSPSANPAINTGGLAIPSTVLAGGVLPGAELSSNQVPDRVTAAFAQASWQAAAPAGFSPFDPAPGIINWVGNAGVDTATIARPTLTTYRETDVLGDPAAPLGLPPVDPLAGLATFGAQLGEAAATMRLVLAELQVRGDARGG
jgi:hypothetical protein